MKATSGFSFLYFLKQSENLEKNNMCLFFGLNIISINLDNKFCFKKRF